MRILFPRFGRTAALPDSILCSFLSFLFAVIAPPALSATTCQHDNAGRLVRVYFDYLGDHHRVQ